MLVNAACENLHATGVPSVSTQKKKEIIEASNVVTTAVHPPFMDHHSSSPLDRYLTHEGFVNMPEQQKIVLQTDATMYQQFAHLHSQYWHACGLLAAEKFSQDVVQLNAYLYSKLKKESQ